MSRARSCAVVFAQGRSVCSLVPVVRGSAKSRSRCGEGTCQRGGRDHCARDRDAPRWNSGIGITLTRIVGRRPGRADACTGSGGCGTTLAASTTGRAGGRRERGPTRGLDRLLLLFLARAFGVERQLTCSTYRAMPYISSLAFHFRFRAADLRRARQRDIQRTAASGVTGFAPMRNRFAFGTGVVSRLLLGTALRRFARHRTSGARGRRHTASSVGLMNWSTSFDHAVVHFATVCAWISTAPGRVSAHLREQRRDLLLHARGRGLQPLRHRREILAPSG